mmetsp:Transcript_20913/g.49303  ORF Transcript_20913/g.49303 Transcript_20913/m.49303 type:complete len:274 (-) Transcript_20913:819-1640(-)
MHLCDCLPTSSFLRGFARTPSAAAAARWFCLWHLLFRKKAFRNLVSFKVRVPEQILRVWVTRIVLKDDMKQIGGLSGLFGKKAGISSLVGIGFVDIALDSSRLFDGDVPPGRGLVLKGPEHLSPDPFVPLASPRRIAGVFLLLGLAFLVAATAFPGCRRRRRPGEFPKVLDGRLFRLEDRPAGSNDHKARSFAGRGPGGVKSEGYGQLGGIFSRFDVLLGDLVLGGVVSVVNDAVKEVVIVLFLWLFGDGRRPPLVFVIDHDNVSLFVQCGWR